MTTRDVGKQREAVCGIGTVHDAEVAEARGNLVRGASIAITTVLVYVEIFQLEERLQSLNLICETLESDHKWVMTRLAYRNEWGRYPGARFGSKEEEENMEH